MAIKSAQKKLAKKKASAPKALVTRRVGGITSGLPRAKNTRSISG